MVDVDASQMELRYAAWESKDPVLRSVFLEGLDPHQATADLCGVSRSFGKTINFASIYGASIGKLVALGLPKKIAKKVKYTLDNEWRVLYDYFGRIERAVVRDGYTKTPYGRTRRLLGATPSTDTGQFLLREGKNFRIQAPASDIVQLLGVWMLRNYRRNALPTMTNHDGLTFDLLDKENLNEMLDTMQEAISTFPDFLHDVLGLEFDIPLEFTVEVGHNWLDKEYIKTITTGN